MANERLKGGRVLPRTLVQEFVQDKRMTLMCLGILMLTVMGFASVITSLSAQKGLSVINALFTVPDALVLIGSLFVTVCLFRIKQNPAEKLFKTTVIACALYAVLQIANGYLRGVTLYTIPQSMGTGELGDIPQEVMDLWKMYLPYNIWSVAVTAFRAGSFALFSRAVNDLRMMTTARYPDRHAAVPASIVMSLTAGMVLCTLALNLLVGGGNVVDGVISVLSFVPELIFYFCGSQLLRHSDLRRRGEI